MPEDHCYICINTLVPPMPDAGDPLWDKAPKAELHEVVSGRTPFLATEFRLLRDDSQGALFLRFLAEDDEVRSTFRLDDECLYRQDVFELFIADGENEREYWEIEVSPYDLHFTGTVLYEGPGQLKLDMDRDIPGFMTRTVFHRENYLTGSVWRIPYAAFHHPPRAGAEWRANLFRIDHSRRGEELQAWQATGEANFHVPERFGRICFS